MQLLESKISLRIIIAGIRELINDSYFQEEPTGLYASSSLSTNCSDPAKDME